MKAILTGMLLAMQLMGAAGALDEAAFQRPGDADRPWVYWFWKNGNISREGITADLEAMQRVGIGGVILMEVSLSVPPGEYTFFSPEWREMFKFAVEEAHRLGLVISMNSAPGWTGSGGPWVTPAQSMQKVVFSETGLSGGGPVEIDLPQPEAVLEYYEDIAVLAFPARSGAYRIEEIAEKALYRRGAFSSQPAVPASLPSLATYAEAPADATISLDKMIDISDHMSVAGRLLWEAPAGAWTVLRIGHTSTGQTNRPAPLPGLECDKLDTAALESHFQQFIDVLLADIPQASRAALVGVHLDSWEVGAQNWTGRMREEFRERRGYDLLPYLPVLSGRVVQSLEISERFLWDLRQTVSDLIAEKHGQRLAELAHEKGLWFSVEPYDMTPCDDMTLGATGDVPMCEFWSRGFDTRFSVTEATSVAHVYGRPIVAAESFTSIDRWLFHPGTIKAQGDWAFSEGVNRLVIHRYIHQPYMNLRPGLSLGPHGLHYERTNTWWEYSRPWHEYLARCQQVLKQGRFIADVLYLNPEGAPNVFQAPEPAPRGYKFDGCTPEALLESAVADQGAITFPSGARYRLLVLPQVERMTPALLGKVEELAEAGVRVIGAAPAKSPSLSGYPECDAEVQALVQALAKVAVAPRAKLQLEQPRNEKRDAVKPAHWIWHTEAEAATPPPPGKRYFRQVAQVPEGKAMASAHIVMTADNSFTLYVNGTPMGGGENLGELFAFDCGAALHAGANVIAVAAENAGNAPNAAGLLFSLTLQFSDGTTQRLISDAAWKSATQVDESWVREAEPAGWQPVHDLGQFGIAPWEDVGRTLVRADPYPESEQVEAQLRDLGVQPDFEAGQPLLFAHRQTEAEDIYFVSNQARQEVEVRCVFRVAGRQPVLWDPETGLRRALHHSSTTTDGRTEIQLRFAPAESYFIVFGEPVASPSIPAQDFPRYIPLAEVPGPWQVTFDPQAGGPAEPVLFAQLDDWSQRTEEGIRYFAGSAVYTHTLPIPEEVLRTGKPLYLDLGRVEILAAVALNGKDLGVVWKEPFRVRIDGAVKPGENALSVRVVNLWPNRMIGDEHLPADSERNSNGTLKAWPAWVKAQGTSPAGRHSFATWKHWSAEDPLLPSGLLGPVRLMTEE